MLAKRLVCIVLFRIALPLHRPNLASYVCEPGMELGYSHGVRDGFRNSESNQNLIEWKKILDINTPCLASHEFIE